MASEFKPLAHFLWVLLKERGLAVKLEEAQIPEHLRAIVGPAVARKIEAVNFYNGELTIRTTSSIWRIELRLRAESIRTAINERIGRNAVQSIVVL